MQNYLLNSKLNLAFLSSNHDIKSTMITEENYLRLKSESYGISISSNLRIYKGGRSDFEKRTYFLYENKRCNFWMKRCTIAKE